LRLWSSCLDVMKQSFGEILHIWGKTWQCDDADNRSFRNLVSAIDEENADIGKSVVLVRAGEGKN